MKHVLQLAALIIGLGLSLPALPQALALAWDNDIFVKQDGGYTNGLRLSWLGDAQHLAGCPDCPAARWGEQLSVLPGFAQGDQYFFGASVEQIMVTPSDIAIPTPQYDDLPYAGLLRGSLLLISRQSQAMTAYGLTLGVTGEASGAASAQRHVHRMTGSTRPMGWRHQLPQKAVVGVVAGHARELLRGQLGGLETSLVTASGLQADRWQGSLEASLYVGIGSRLPHNFLPMYGATGNAGSMVGVGKNRGLGWMLYAGLETHLMGWSYMETEGRRAGYQFRNKDMVAGLSGGLALQYRGLLAVLAMQATTDYMEVARLDDGSIGFGSFSLIYRL